MDRDGDHLSLLFFATGASPVSPCLVLLLLGVDDADVGRKTFVERERVADGRIEDVDAVVSSGDDTLRCCCWFGEDTVLIVKFG